MKQRRERGSGSVLKLKDKEGNDSRYWYILYYVNGKQIRESSGSEVKQVALKKLQNRLGERELGLKPAQEMRRLRYEDIRSALLDTYALQGAHILKTRKSGEKTVDGLKYLDEFFKGQSVLNITSDSIRRFIIKRQSDGVENATINRNLALLRRMLRLANQEGKLQAVPHFSMLKESKPRQGFIEHSQFETLRAALPERLRPLITFLYFTGCRVGAAQKIRWNQVNLNRREIRLNAEQVKNDEDIVLPLPAELVYAIRASERNDDSLVFDVGSFRTVWENTCVRLGFGQFSDKRNYSGLLVHDLRRSAVRNLRKAGVPESVAMKISGHKTRAVFERYNIVDASDVHAAMSRVENARKVLDVPVENNTRMMQESRLIEEKAS